MWTTSPTTPPSGQVNVVQTPGNGSISIVPQVPSLLVVIPTFVFAKYDPAVFGLKISIFVTLKSPGRSPYQVLLDFY